VLARSWFCLALLACGARGPSTAGPSKTVKLWVERAEKAEENRDHEVARKHYERAIANAKDPVSIGYARREFAETLATWGEIDSARGQLEKAVAASPDDPIAWQMLGIVRASDAIKDIPGAFEALEKSKTLAPKSWIPRRDLAVLHWKVGHKKESLAEYKAMLELNLPTRLREKVEWAIEELEKEVSSSKSSSTDEPDAPKPAPAPSP
jgi:tetratricopeptide (TPR) repeat protein